MTGCAGERVRAAGASISLGEAESILRDACGMTLSAGIRRSVLDAVDRAARDAHLAPPVFAARLRARDPASVCALVEAAVIGETYFFRHPEQLEALRAVLLEPAPRDRPLAIWSAGCATGEEPYTFAMMLLDAGRGRAGDRILATDVSGRALAVAREAVYGEWSLRRLDPAIRARHFEPRPPQLAVRSEARALVELRAHNLVQDGLPEAGFDVVLCRNVLIYFEAATASAVVARLAAAVRPGGLLVLGPVETPFAAGLGLEVVEHGGALLHRVIDPTRRPDPPRRPAREARRAPPPRAVAGPAPGRVDARRAPRERLASTPAEPVERRAESATPGIEAARDAARRGDLGAAERIARDAAARDLCPEAWLLVSMTADARGDLAAAVDAVRCALYLEPGLALGHAALVPLYARLGLADDAARARRNALAAIADLDDAAPLRGVETITAGALRSALHHHHRIGRGGASAAGSER
jgi:chemotaxis protein methyltransferase CheR